MGLSSRLRRTSFEPSDYFGVSIKRYVIVPGDIKITTARDRQSSWNCLQ
jgi:hypothetical protein